MCSMIVYRDSSSMIREAKEGANSYMERSSPDIFRAIQIHVGDSLGPINLSKHEEGSRGRL